MLQVWDAWMNVSQFCSLLVDDCWEILCHVPTYTARKMHLNSTAASDFMIDSLFSGTG